MTNFFKCHDDKSHSSSYTEMDYLREGVFKTYISNPAVEKDNPHSLVWWGKKLQEHFETIPGSKFNKLAAEFLERTWLQELSGPYDRASLENTINWDKNLPHAGLERGLVWILINFSASIPYLYFLNWLKYLLNQPAKKIKISLGNRLLSSVEKKCIEKAAIEEVATYLDRIVEILLKISSPNPPGYDNEFCNRIGIRPITLGKIRGNQDLIAWLIKPPLGKKLIKPPLGKKTYADSPLEWFLRIAIGGSKIPGPTLKNVKEGLLFELWEEDNRKIWFGNCLCCYEKHTEYKDEEGVSKNNKFKSMLEWPSQKCTICGKIKQCGDLSEKIWLERGFVQTFVIKCKECRKYVFASGNNKPLLNTYNCDTKKGHKLSGRGLGTTAKTHIRSEELIAQFFNKVRSFCSGSICPLEQIATTIGKEKDAVLVELSEVCKRLDNKKLDTWFENRKTITKFDSNMNDLKSLIKEWGKGLSNTTDDDDNDDDGKNLEMSKKDFSIMNKKH